MRPSQLATPLSPRGGFRSEANGLAGVGAHRYHRAMEPTTDVLDADGAELDEDQLVEEELLVEEISIDGMCGVY